MKQIAYAVWPKKSNGMLSDNPYTGCVTEVDVARTLDCTIPEPSKGQGGVMILSLLWEMCHTDNPLRPVNGGVAPTLQARLGTGGNNVPVLLDTDVIGVGVENDIAGTLDAHYFKGPGTRGGKERTMVSQGEYWKDGDVADTLTASNAGGSQRMPDKDNYNGVIQGRVRRLTVTECERLQGLPDGYTAAAGSDSARYKAIGNGMAQPCADFVLRRIVEVEQDGKGKETDPEGTR